MWYDYGPCVADSSLPPGSSSKEALARLNGCPTRPGARSRSNKIMIVQLMLNKIMIVQLMLNKWVLNGVMVGTPVALHGGTAWRAYQSELLLDQLNLYF